MFLILKPEKLEVGMYVILPPGARLKNINRHQFLISNEETLQKLLNADLNDVTVDKNRSNWVFDENDLKTKERVVENVDILKPETWDTNEFIPDQLKEVIYSKKIEPEKKAEIVYKASVDVMRKLMESPTTENIREYKDGVNDVVELILGDRNTSNHMLGITSHDYYTYTHSVNVGVLSIMLAKNLFKGKIGHDMNELGAGFFLHDLGKVRVPSYIINKQGRLENDEMDKMRQHPSFGYELLSDALNLSDEIRIIVQQHHERCDGTGYPLGLGETDIHYYGRLCSIADVYDALTSKRPYKRSMTPFEALKLMKNEMIQHFDRKMFEQFVLLFS